MSPAVTNAITSCSRGVRVCEFHPDVGNRLIAFTANAIPFEPEPDGIEHVLVAKRFGRNSMAPAFMAFTVIGMSPWPVHENDRDLNGRFWPIRSENRAR